ncbi:lipid IV(A) 3-deoxy-D-manno-octulosonic acid transferase [Vibrio sp. SCSIO 43137]|uniref:lipid IV(A) 3-deoxy-D-manno-octulosonic acid transferase n=1 Tax=Vibrio sp. SCSIO 43137 TaxID=3021011 RepID=UPI002307A2CB|nr:lipid IV(A) 3-deoxy-D-manno-octulosonic acid transferase [Vibrio sp. SCSIO 43137]WCE29859.1 lipid IV(A) 3-deoxy-D-manno-octulosonic acid transferase [Vibrio sp. SCSIO 43137]
MITRLLYTVLLIIASPLLLFGLYRSKPNKPHFGWRWKEHFGLAPKLETTEPPIWIHAVSVGECIAAKPLIKALKKQNPEQPILITTTTSTGAKEIEKLGDIIAHRYMPLDFSFAIRFFLKKINPCQLLIIETELWPNTLNEVHRFDIPITIVNARLSEKSYQNYAKIQFLFNEIHPKISKILCQTQVDADRFERLGVPSEKIEITGSIKFDIEVSDNNIKSGLKLREKIGINRPVWIAASTHKGEDEIILNAHKLILKTYPSTLLILVPRHPERFATIHNLCTKNGYKTTQRTDNEIITKDHSVYIGNTMGEMLTLISSSDVCFMGGSLIGNTVGGHNLLEPAALGKPMLIGPSYFNFKDITEQLLKVKSVDIVSNASEISKEIISKFDDKELLALTGDAAKEVVKKNQGAIRNTLIALDLKMELSQ